jgi:transcriptional regulator with XRE-family HTH domain
MKPLIFSIMNINQEIVNKIKFMRKQRQLSSLDVAEKLNIDISTYNRLESGKTLTWSRYFEDLLIVFDMSAEEFFQDLIVDAIKIKNREGSFERDNLNVENINSQNHLVLEKLIAVYEERLQEKDLIIAQLQQIIDKFMK